MIPGRTYMKGMLHSKENVKSNNATQEAWDSLNPAEKEALPKVSNALIALREVTLATLAAIEMGYAKEGDVEKM
jgi:hypothetical protein